MSRTAPPPEVGDVPTAALESKVQAVNVRVSNNRQQFTDQSNLFDYYTAPNISKVEPTAGPERGGTLVYIDGNHFIQYVSSGVRTSITCRFGNTVVTATLVTSQLLTCLAPKHPPGTFKFSVSLNDQQYTDFPFYFTFPPGMKGQGTEGQGIKAKQEKHLEKE